MGPAARCGCDRPTGPDIDQRLPADWEDRQWDQTAPCWADTPLGQWATQANRWDGIDPIPQEDEPAGIQTPAGRHRAQFQRPERPPAERGQRAPSDFPERGVYRT